MSQAAITWYGHSCFRVDLAGSSIILDPYMASSVPGLRLPDLTADAVHVSHGHSDHCAADRVEHTGRTLNFIVREVLGYHDDCCGQRSGENRILVIEGDGLRIVHLGDQGCVLTPEQVEEIGRPDLLMLPVGGYCTVGAVDARTIAGQLQARVIVPMHYRQGNIGYDVLSTVEPFLTGELPVVRSRSRQFVLTPDMPDQILIPKLVQ